jgi:hypothetical protein
MIHNDRSDCGPASQQDPGVRYVIPAVANVCFGFHALSQKTGFSPSYSWLIELALLESLLISIGMFRVANHESYIHAHLNLCYACFFAGGELVC